MKRVTLKIPREGQAPVYRVCACGLKLTSRYGWKQHKCKAASQAKA
jgi:hypothetical protein